MTENGGASQQPADGSDVRVAAAFDALPAQVAVVDADGVIVETNRAWARFGRDNGIRGAPDSVGENYLTLCDGADDEMATAAATGIRAVLAGERDEFTLEYPCHSPDERRWFTMRAIPLDDCEGAQALVMHVNITERREAERRVEANNETLSTVTNVLGHDLRNPLNVALGRADYLANHPESGADAVVEQTTAVVDSLERMNAIIEDALVLARESEGAEFERVDLGTVARDAWAQVRTGGATLRVVDDVTLLADASLLAQLFENLFRNSVEHAGCSGVVVGATPGGFFVADDGPGIPEDDSERVFEAGYSTGKADGSTGMGLAIVTRVAETHGWEVGLADPEGDETEDAPGARFVVSGIATEG